LFVVLERFNIFKNTYQVVESELGLIKTVMILMILINNSPYAITLSIVIRML